MKHVSFAVKRILLLRYDWLDKFYKDQASMIKNLVLIRWRHVSLLAMQKRHDIQHELKRRILRETASTCQPLSSLLKCSTSCWF
jgi:hypothetical protein